MPSDPAAAWAQAVREGARHLYVACELGTAAEFDDAGPAHERRDEFVAAVDETIRSALASLDRAGFVLTMKRITAESGHKYKMIGEFKVSFPTVDEEGEETTGSVAVPWTTIKEIYGAAIAARPALPPEETKPDV